MAVKNHLQIIGGSKVGLANITLKDRELGYCIDTKELFIGRTVGGVSTNTKIGSVFEVESLPSENILTDTIYYLTVDVGDSPAGLYYYRGGKWYHLAEGKTEFSAIIGEARENTNLRDELNKLEWQIEEDGDNADFTITRGKLSTENPNPKTKIKLNVIDDSLSTSTIKTYSIDKIVEMVQTMSTTFRGSFDTLAALKADTSFVPDNNDTAVVKADETHENECWMYKFVATDTSKPKVGEWTAAYCISVSTVIADDITIEDKDSTSGLKFGFKSFENDDDKQAEKIWRVTSEGKWALNDLSDKQYKLVIESTSGLVIDETDAKNPKLALAETVDFGTWD